MKHIIKLFGLGVLTFLTSCENQNRDIADKTEESIDDVKEQASDIKSSFTNEFKELRDNLDDEIEEIKSKMDEASDDTKAEYQKQLDGLENRRDQLSDRWDDFKNNTNNDIEKVKKDLDAWFDEVEKDLSNSQQIKDMIREGTKVKWKWGNGTAQGKVKESFTTSVTKTINGNEVTRNGESSNKALYIDTGDSFALKLESEVSRVDT